MKAWTYAEILEKVQNDLDMQDEIFITDAEWLGYVNEAIDDCEADIHQLNEEYFKTSAQVPMVQGTARYAMPDDIYANKIKLVFYDEGYNNSDTYKVWQMKDKNKADVEDNDDYEFDVENSSTNGIEFVLYPAARVTSSTYMTVWYIRNANRIALSTDTLDIPEFANFIMQHMKMRCMEKETHPMLGKAVQDLEAQRMKMRETLSQMIPDHEETIEPDLTFYEEMS